MSQTPPGTSFGKRLRELRRGLDLTQAELAGRVGCSPNMLRKLEADERRPSRALADRLAQVLELTVSGRGEFVRDARSTRAIRQSMLPALVTRLIGREAALRELRERVLGSGVRLLTLVGPPGVGKTRLALQLAAEVEAEFEHGVAFVPLAGVRDAQQVLETMAQVLGVRGTSEMVLADALAAHLQSRQMCLLVDNFEQVLAARVQVSELLRQTAHLKVLVTSREALAIYGEHVYVVQPLALPDATTSSRRSASETLFLERARAVRPDYPDSADARAEIAQICLRLEGLPLAIELAASRARFDSPAELLARLERRLDTLTSGPSDFSARQSSLRGALDWSFELLEPGQQRLLARLSVFDGGASRAAIGAVCNSADVVEALVDKSLVQLNATPNGTRFNMLETVREYAQQHLSAPEAEALRKQHAVYFLGLAEAAVDALRGHQQHAVLASLQLEHANFRTALDWAVRSPEAEIAGRLCAALWPFWRIRGYFHEGRRWLGAALGRADELSEPTQAAALNGAGVLALLQGDFAQAGAQLEEARALYATLGDSKGLGHAISNLGWLAHDRSEYERAAALFDESLRLRRAAGDAWGEAWTLNNLGMVRLECGDMVAAGAAFDDSVRLFRTQGDQIGAAQALTNLGWVNQELGQYERAARLFEESLALCQHLDDARNVANNLSNLGLMAVYAGDYSRAHDLFTQALVAFHDLGERRGTAEALEGLAGVAGLQGRAAEAARLFGHADLLRESIGAPLLPADRARYEVMLRTAHEQVDPVTWASAWDAGRSATIDELLTQLHT